MKPFALLVDYNILSSSVESAARSRLRFGSVCGKFEIFPYNSSDYSEFDPVGRQIYINVSAKYALKYWIDEADRQIKIFGHSPV